MGNWNDIPSETRQAAVEAIRDADRITVFSGAGISAESGISTFRDADGFWQRFPPEEFANWKGLLTTATLQPKRFAEFLLAVLEPIANATPNAAHRAIADLEQSKEVQVVTQNIDNLHQEAGSTTVHEVHGTLFEIVSLSGDKRSRMTREQLKEVVGNIHIAHDSGWTAPRLLVSVQPLLGLDMGGVHRPNLVLFGDAMAEPAWTDSIEAARNCDVLLIVGTSGEVYPAATLPQEAKERGASVITIDPIAGFGPLWLQGNAGDILPQLVAESRT